MSLEIGALNLRFEAHAEHRSTAERVGQEARSCLSEAFGAALASHAANSGVVVVPRLRVTVRAPLGGMRGRDLARAIADACLRAAVNDSSTLAACAADREEGTAERTLRALTVLEGVRIDRATEAAAWLAALARDERTVLRRASPYADLEHLSSAAALVAVCARVGARAVLVSLGTTWAYTLARRCSAAEAIRLLAMLDDGSEPTAHTWRMLAERAAHAAQAGESEVRALLLAIRGVFEGYPGAVNAARVIVTLPAAASTSGATPALAAQALAGAEERRSIDPGSGETPFESVCTGFWLLLAHLTRRIWEFDEESARAIAFVVAERLWGALAGDDPAIRAFTGEREPAALRSAVPPQARIDRLSVCVVRDFARTLGHFERARAGYLLRRMLFGPGLVWRTAEGWAATLPQSPIRIVLERACLLGEAATPWSEPKLAFARDP
jgi:hypothetical protein